MDRFAKPSYELETKAAGFTLLRGFVRAKVRAAAVERATALLSSFPPERVQRAAACVFTYAHGEVWELRVLDAGH